jgi:disulfide bond formation protein DsbB
MPAVRTMFLLIFLACMGMIGVGMYFQEVMDLQPCYMCILQRIFIIATGTVALFAYVINPGPTGIKFFAVFTALIALVGSFFSGKQLWLQSLPEDQIPDCGVSVDYLFEVHNLGTALSHLFKGDGNCAEVQWVFAGLSIPGWTLVAFITLATIALWQIIRIKKAS